MARIALAGGGTAGHTSPLIATAERLTERDPDGALLAIGTARGLETSVIPAAGLELDLVDPVPMPRRPNADLVKLPVRLRRSVRQAREILQRFRADVVVGFGGYVSVPAYLAARGLKLPLIIHEGNAVPGIANRLGARFADRVAVTFPNAVLPKAEHVGLPLRRAITDLARLDDEARAATRARSRAGFGLDLDRPTLLVSGGSQGARSINTAVRAVMDDLLASGVQVLHVLGPKNMSQEHQPVEDTTTGGRYLPVAYVDAMEDAYAAADLMIGRSGAGTVVETAVVGLPTVLVPLPHGNGEQARNAASLVAAGGAELCPDAEFTPDRVRAALQLLQDPTTLGRMARAGQDLMPADADRQLAEMILAAVR